MDQIWRFAYQLGREHGFEAGYQQALADDAAEWQVTRQLLVGAVHPVLDPEGDAKRRIRAAEAAAKRDAADQERAFVARAYSTPEDQRTDAQRATLQSYPPPDARRRMAGAA